MEMPSKYDPKLTEDKWYKYWLENKFFRSVPDQRPPYTIVIPPPNVTGVLHMGHMLNNTIQDVLVRRARMQGKNACWVPGTDHASIATEAKVVGKLASEGIKKTDLSREEFLKHAWEWTHKHGGIILEQLKKLGASCDWDRTCFTMDKERSESVIQVFVDLFKKGLIYRGVRMVNWDPQALTAISDEEVIYKEVSSKLYYVRYQIVDSDKYVVIATTRPETILGDTAVCVNPEDERYHYLKGKKVYVPLIKRAVPVIFDEYVDREFGTGVLKITPAHDINDYTIGQKHNLETIDIFNDNGTLNDKAILFVGEDRFVVRDKIVEKLSAEKHIEKIENYTNKVGFSERTDAVIEPKLSMQWFLTMKDLSQPALENVMNDQIKLYPAKFKNTYRHWMENVKDWCISRQLWWGHRIPAYYINNTNDYVVAENDDEALKLAIQKTGNPGLTMVNLKQDEDVLDTWCSSWLWPISVFDGIRNPDNADIKYYYPTDDLVTAPEILFFWVARMIIAGYEYRKDKPFKNVYLTGIVRDKQGRKMSKQLGNSPDPIMLMNQYGADGVRVGMLLCSPAGNDLPFDESLTEQGRNFGNKIWNAFRLVKSWEVDSAIPQPEASAKAVEWFNSILNKTIEELDDQFIKFRISEALMSVYKLFWDEFSSWYLEIIKPAYQQKIDSKTLDITLEFFDKLVKLLHPFMPFITEEIWHHIAERKDGESVMIEGLPNSNTEKINLRLFDLFEEVKNVVAFIRNTRNENKISPKDPISLWIKNDLDGYDYFDCVIKKLANTDEIERKVPENVGRVATYITNSAEYYIPLGDYINIEEEIQKLEDELKYTKGFLDSVNKKLKNEKFMAGAPPQVVQNELKKKDDSESKIKALEEQLKILNF
jgi:valyl-tRNA synthetase